jgi:hypothetical protein
MRPNTPKGNAELIAGTVTAVIATGMLFVPSLDGEMKGTQLRRPST